MHGRVKVRTTEEQERIKQIEKQKKAAEFKKAIERVFQKRKNHELDDELLLITEKLLVRHPDVYTLWNIRREIFLYLIECSKWSDEELTEKLGKELTLTESCLRENPKSYCVWHQRTWIIEQLPNPNYKRELELCNKCLNLDERNFHCWDYRQFIVDKANISDQEELEFSLSKILSNFSNYSSWHYRSRLLKKLYPSDVHDLPIRTDKHNEELDLVMNATFTDPNDSSAWFYQRWLLDCCKSSSKLWKAVLSNSVITVVFHKAVPLNLELLINGEKIDCDWKSANGKKYSVTWYAELKNSPCDGANEVTLRFEENLYNFYQSELSKEWIYKSETVSGNFNSDTLKDQLNNYQMLLEMEPLNKWAKSTSTYLMLHMNSIDSNSKIIQQLNDLIMVDPLRANYYKDMRSKYTLEYHISMLSNSKDNNFVHNANLSNLELTTLSSQEPYLSFFHEVNFSNNNLGSRLYQLYTLQECCKLDLSNNTIFSLKSFPKLRSLKVLILSNNQISNSEEIIDLIKKHNLTKLDLKDNSLDDVDSLVKNIKNISPEIELII